MGAVGKADAAAGGPDERGHGPADALEDGGRALLVVGVDHEGLPELVGGAGLVFTEMTCVSPEGRISPGCTGMWNADHVAAWTRIVDFVHENSKAKICLQLGHSGGKGSTKLGWEGNDIPLDDGAQQVVAEGRVLVARAGRGGEGDAALHEAGELLLRVRPRRGVEEGEAREPDQHS